MAVPYTFGSATTSIPLSQLDSNFATTITLGNTAIQLGNTVTTLNNMTLANATVSSGNATVTTLTAPTHNSASSLAFQTNGTTTAMTIDTSQNVGIGTASPTVRLTVVTGSSANNEGTIRVSDNASYYGEFKRVNATDELRIGSYGTSQNMTFYTVASERMRIDSSGNVGIGVTPSSWLSSIFATQIGNYGSVYAFKSSGNVYLNNNTYVNSGGSDVYLNTAPAGRYRISDNTHIWYNAPSGTAGTNASLTQAMTLDSSGNLLLGGTTASGVLTITAASASSAISIRSGAGELSRTVGQTATSVSTTATAILPTSLGYGGLAIVNGISSINSFADLVFFAYSTASAISSQTVTGSPVARTYTCVTGQLKLAMASGTYTITAVQQSINAY
jgi:hypothetical protein